MRIGGFDQTVPNRTSSGTSSGATTVTLSMPLSAAFAAQSARARSLTSIAHTLAPGARRASVRAMAPEPQPRSSTSPTGAGGGADRRSSAVPASRRPWLNTPRSVRTVKLVSGNSTVTVASADGAPAVSSK